MDRRRVPTAVDFNAEVPCGLEEVEVRFLLSLIALPGKTGNTDAGLDLELAARLFPSGFKGGEESFCGDDLDPEPESSEKTSEVVLWSDPCFQLARRNATSSQTLMAHQEKANAAASSREDRLEIVRGAEEFGYFFTWSPRRNIHCSHMAAALLRRAPWPKILPQPIL